jgi:hypothetical protein
VPPVPSMARQTGVLLLKYIAKLHGSRVYSMDLYNRKNESLFHRLSIKNSQIKTSFGSNGLNLGAVDLKFSFH